MSTTSSALSDAASSAAPPSQFAPLSCSSQPLTDVPQGDAVTPRKIADERKEAQRKVQPLPLPARACLPVLARVFGVR